MISTTMRVLLFIGSLILFMYVVRKLRKSQLSVSDTMFWFGLALILMVLSVFPEIAISCAEFLGVISPVNFIFLCIIFLLLLSCFILTIRTAKLEEQVHNLAQEMALREKLEREKTDSNV